MIFKILSSSLLLLCLATVNTVSASFKQTDILLKFTDFVQIYNKNYSDDELSYRFNVFIDNYKTINDHNSQGHSWTMAINKFADLTPNEFKSQHLCYNPVHSKTFLGRTYFTNTVSDLPTDIDWTSKGVVTPVKDQGQCGSCWAFSSTGSIEGAYALATGKLVSLSEQQLVDCSRSYGNEGCNGGLFVPSFQYTEKTPLCSQSDYEYKGVDGTCKDCTGVTTVDSYVEVTKNSESALQQALLLQPISVAIEADQFSFQFYSSGVMSGTCGTNLDHGVLLVGYGTDNGKDFWKIKNSWGANWGENGYIRLSRNVKQVQGQCGIAMEPSYPIISKS